MKKQNIIISSVLSVFTVAGILAGCSNANLNTSNNNDFSALQILKSDFKLTSEQQTSRIKQEYLIANNGYKDDDVLTVMVSLDKKPLMDSYLDLYQDTYNSVSDYMLSSNGIAQVNSIASEQEDLISTLNKKGLIEDVEYTYNTLINAIAVNVKYKNLNKLSSIKGVSEVTLSDTYSLPLTAKSGNDTSAIINNVDVYETGIFNSGSVEYTGIGTAVAVLDSGFDLSHEVFATQPNCSDDRLWIKESDISAKISSLKAFDLQKQKHKNELKLTDVYESKKIPFVYDYADKDFDVYPYDSEHGTHVAGIIGGQSSTITGVAINTQLVLMKVFPDLDSGANTDDILSALEDAVKLNVDAINLSLGSSCGFTREKDGNLINTVYDKIGEAGISLITAASNSYSSAYGSDQGNTNMVTNPDSGTVGSPSTYNSALSVASISGKKTRYLYCNDSDVVFFTESLSNTAKENDFVKELGITASNQSHTYEYVTVPGDGLSVSYNDIDVNGKIALIRRGTNTFEEKAELAKLKGAVAAIIYNNIDGTISMSMGKKDHIPTISISRDDGEKLAKKSKGTITVNFDYQAGPFMSDYSSWGPTPSLEIKPEITAHGGDILSSMPGNEYDHLSGTSMASPNMCGMVILVKQYIKDTYPTLNSVEVNHLANQMLMSTANIVLNEEGNPYAVRKQGAGLANLKNAVNTKAIITVDGKDKPKIELYDDPNKTGIYEMKFNIVNLSNETLNYDLDIIGMSESVSTSDSKHVSEKSHILNGAIEATLDGQGSINNKGITVAANGKVSVTAKYKLSDADKTYIDSLFPYGMYVEGFVKLNSKNNDEISLSCPFLAFYGDWTKAPMFDKTYYEVETTKYDDAIDDEDKIKADLYATTPYGSYYYNYMIPLGTYMYDMPEGYDKILASEDHIAISNILGTIDGIASVYAGLLRNAKTMTFTITDETTGSIIYEYVDYNCVKSYYAGQTLPYYEYLKLNSQELNLINNRRYTFSMKAALDYGDGGEKENLNNTYSFSFVLDDEAPVVTNARYETVYDKTLKKDRYYLYLTVYDNQYAMALTPIAFTSSSSYVPMIDKPIPIYSEKGGYTTVKYEITDWLENLEYDALISDCLGILVEDYALNQDIYLVSLPGINGDLKFTKDGDIEGSDITILSVCEDEIIDLNKYLASTDKVQDDDKEYGRYMKWSSTNEEVAEVNEGLLVAKKAGKTVISVVENLNGKEALLIVNVKETKGESDNHVGVISPKNKVTSIRFAYFDTLFAYSRAAQTSEIGQTGSKTYVEGSTISFYPGESIKLHYDFDPFYAEENYNLTYSSSNESIATVTSDGVVTGLKEGTTTIMLSIEGSTLMARIRVKIKNPFVIENRTLIAYKGLGGEVVIPDDEGILYIGSYSFCLYNTDYSVIMDEDDYDSNKIPQSNTSITKVVIPEGVEEIQKYAFYNCTGLKEVVMPSTINFIREYAFYNDSALETIDTHHVLSIGARSFYNTESLKEVNLDRCYAVGTSAFEKSGLTSVNLSKVRNMGDRSFKDTTSLTSITMTKDTKLSRYMLLNTGLEEIDIYANNIPDYFLTTSKNLKTINVKNDVIEVGYDAFGQCPELIECNFEGKVEIFGDLTFYQDSKLPSITLPNNAITVGNYMFYDCDALETLKFGANTVLTTMNGNVFASTNIQNFIIDTNNSSYSVNASHYLCDSDGNILRGIVNSEEAIDLVIGADINYIGNSAFAGLNIKSVTILNPNCAIGDYAFAEIESLTTVNLPVSNNITIGDYAFYKDSNIVNITNIEGVSSFGKYAFSQAFTKTEGIDITIKENATVEEGAFLGSKVINVVIGNNASIGFGSFQKASYLKDVNFLGTATLSNASFAQCVSLKKANLNNIEVIPNECFYGDSNLLRVDLDNAISIGRYAFADCSALGTITLGKVVSLDEGCFARYETYGGAPTITSITLPNTLTTIGDGVFLGCEGLGSIEIPSSVTTMGDYVFAYCVNLQDVTLGENVKYIGKYAFAGNESLRSINLENVEEIAELAFTQDTLLHNVTLTKVETIGYGAFASSGLEGYIVAPELKNIGTYAFQLCDFTMFSAPKVEVIEDCAFDSCKKLTSFYIPSSIQEIGYGIFRSCESLEAINASSNKINDTYFLNDGDLYKVMDNDAYALVAVANNADKAVLNVLEGTTYICNYGGGQNANIEYITLPDSLKAIGQYAFYEYKNLKEVEFKSFTAPVFEDSYNRNSTVEETDPGYDLLHHSYELFGYELYYYTFVDLLGTVKPINMVIPSNANVASYTNLVYEGYFGNIKDVERSTYVATEDNIINFVNYAKEIDEIESITLANKSLVENAIIAMNAIKQNPSDHGYDEVTWNNYVKTVKDASEKIRLIQFSISSQKIKDAQAKLDTLSKHFSINDLDSIKSVIEVYNALSVSERKLLETTNYSTIMSEFETYLEELNNEAHIAASLGF